MVREIHALNKEMIAAGVGKFAHSSLRRLVQINPASIAALNRAVAVSMVQGPAAGLDALDAATALAGDSALAGYHLFPSVRGEALTPSSNDVIRRGQRLTFANSLSNAFEMFRERIGRFQVGRKSKASPLLDFAQRYLKHFELLQIKKFKLI